jgi:hypothetical protein
MMLDLTLQPVIVGIVLLAITASWAFPKSKHAA